MNEFAPMAELIADQSPATGQRAGRIFRPSPARYHPSLKFGLFSWILRQHSLDMVRYTVVKGRFVVV
jgi:hypothetical protein